MYTSVCVNAPTARSYKWTRKGVAASAVEFCCCCLFFVRISRMNSIIILIMLLLVFTPRAPTSRGEGVSRWEGVPASEVEFLCCCCVFYSRMGCVTSIITIILYVCMFTPRAPTSGHGRARLHSRLKSRCCCCRCYHY